MKKKHLNFEDLIIYQDEHLFAINKPSGISSLEERNEPNTGLLNMARRWLPESSVCHRLDKYTTGVLLFAKNPEVYRLVAIAFEKRKVEKRYHALVQSNRELDHHVIDLPLGALKNGIVKVDFNQGKPALTVVSSLEQFLHYTLLDCVPTTGRSHQIRVHLASMRLPIVGDALYGGEDLFLSRLKRKYRHAQTEERPLNDGYLLHARLLCLPHPVTQEVLTIEAPYHKNFAVSLELLRKHDAYKASGYSNGLE